MYGQSNNNVNGINKYESKIGKFGIIRLKISYEISPKEGLSNHGIGRRLNVVEVPCSR